MQVVVSGEFKHLRATESGQMHEAAMCGDVGLLEDCLNEGKDVDSPDKVQRGYV
jgi:hypothetical protein